MGILYIYVCVCCSGCVDADVQCMYTYMHIGI